MDENTKNYLLSKYSAAERKKIEDQNADESWRDSLSGGLASLAAAFQGRDSMSAAMGALDRGQKVSQSRLDAFDKAKANAVGDYQNERQFSKDAREDDLYKRETSLDSEETKLARTLAKKMAPGIDFSNMSAAQINEKLPSLKEIYKVEQDRLNRIDARNAKAAEKSAKQAELSAAQAKQRGLYESGALASDQYSAATATKDGYDPTSNLEFIDNSSWAPNWLKNDKAVAAQAAQGAWVESFLRDASGAAIPESERGAYAKQFFPQPGDSNDVVANKAALRAQKEENARVGAGGDLPGSQIPKKQIKSPTQPSGHRPGDIVRVKGKSYRVGQDGDSLEPV